MQQPRGSVGRTRFLLALSLSTVTALAVAAPLTLQALNAGEGGPSTGVPAVSDGSGIQPADDLLSDEADERRLDDDGDSRGGIGTRPRAKAQAHTSKSDERTVPETDPEPSGSSSTNPPRASSSVSEPEREPAPENRPTTTSAPTTSTTAPTTSTSATSTTSTVPVDSTTTTVDSVPDTAQD